MGHQEAVKKNEFASKLGFVMAAAGSAIGIGNIWSFPTLAANFGGGAFLFSYLVFTLFLGFPMLVAEIALGRHGGQDPASSLVKVSGSPLAKKIGFLAGSFSVLVAFFILSFYSVVAGWFFSFALEPFTTLMGFGEFSSWLTSFSHSEGRDIFFTLLFAVLTFTVVKQGIEEGIERWSKKLMPLLFALLFGLSVYLLFLPGAMEGLKHYLVPDFAKVLQKDVLLASLGQSFFSLSLGAGVMMVYGAYLGKKENLVSVTGLVVLLDTLVAFLAGLLIIPATYVAKERGVEVFTAEGLLIDSDRLVFSVLPELFQSMGGFSFFVAPLFYLLMIVAALTSSISMLEAPVSFLSNQTKLGRKKSVSLVSFLAFCTSVSIILNFDFLFYLIRTFATQYAQPLVSLCITLFVGYVWNRHSLLKELASGDDSFSSSLFWKVWPWYLRIVCPILVLVVIIQSF